MRKVCILKLGIIHYDSTRLTKNTRYLMELPDITYPVGDYIETASGNKVSRSSFLPGSQNIVLSGRCIVQSDSILRGDLAPIRVGKYSTIKRGVILHPGFKKLTDKVVFFQLTIGENVIIGEDSVVSAAQVGSYSYIGNNCVLGTYCKLKECCRIEDDTVIPPETVVAPFLVYAGNPGRPVKELPESTQETMIEHTRSYYKHFIADTTK